MNDIQILRKSVRISEPAIDRASFHKFLRVLGLNSADQFAQELVLISNIWIIDDLVEKVILILGATQIQVCVICVKRISGCLAVLGIHFLLGFQIFLNAHALRLHRWDHRLLDGIGLNGHATRLYLFRNQSLVKAFAQGAYGYLSNIDVHIIELPDHGLVF